ncbi:MAG: hypothetical protein O3B04_07470 [Chloroflexi bacterium]|nr:hypothetical protein [Chloroflexota bacterium]
MVDLLIKNERIVDAGACDVSRSSQVRDTSTPFQGISKVMPWRTQSTESAHLCHEYRHRRLLQRLEISATITT